MRYRMVSACISVRRPASVARAFLLEAFPESEEVRGPEGAIMQAIAGASTLPPDHPPVVGPRGPGEPAMTQRRQYAPHVHIAMGGRVRHFMETALARSADVPAMREVNTPSLAEPTRHRDEIVVGARA